MNYRDLDRTRFEKTYVESTRRGAFASLFHAIIFGGGILYFAPAEAGWGMYAILFSFCANSIARGVLFIKARAMHSGNIPVPPRLFQNLYRATATFLGLAWGLAFLFGVREFGYSHATMAVFVSIMGFVPGSLSLCAMDMFVAGSFILCSSVPVIVTCLVVRDPAISTLSLASFYLLHILYNMTILRKNKLTFFETVASQIEVETQKQQLEGILNAVPGYVTWFNPAGEKIGSNQVSHHSLAPKEAASSSHLHHKPMETDSEISRLLLKFRESDDLEIVHQLKADLGGEERWYILALRKFRAGADENVVAVVVDISNEKFAQEELASEKQRVTQSERLSLIGAMAGGVAHEINNPLAIIRGRLERMQELSAAGELGQDKAQELAVKALQTVDRIARIVRGLRLMARGESNDAPTLYNLVDLCRDVIELAGSRVRQAEAKVSFESEEPRIELLCQPTQMSQILLNLVQNSLDAIAGNQERWVKISIKRDRERVDISVTDSGLSSSIRHPERVFEPFFTTKAAGEGSGLGLSISQTLARRYGGDLRLDLTKANTCFHLIVVNQPESGVAVEPDQPQLLKPARASLTGAA